MIRQLGQLFVGLTYADLSNVKALQRLQVSISLQFSIHNIQNLCSECKRTHVRILAP